MRCLSRRRLLRALSRPMRTTLDIEDERLAKAQRVSGLKQRTELVELQAKTVIRDS